MEIQIDNKILLEIILALKQQVFQLEQIIKSQKKT